MTENMSNARAAIKEQKNDFYAHSYQSLMIILVAEIIIILIMVTVVLYQVFHRPLPIFTAITPSKQQMQLTASSEPNLLPSTLITWASKGAVAAYTFDFALYNEQIALARPYFTEQGWKDYQASIASLIQTITQNQLFVSSVVVGPPVISNQGELPKLGYTWRIQIPFLVRYLSEGPEARANYTVVVTLVRVPTSINPAGIGINQFVMTS